MQFLQVVMVLCKFLFILVLTSPALATNSVANIVHYTPYHEAILCRSCGHDIANTKYLIPKASSFSKYSFYDTIFNPQQDVLVQMVADYLFFHYPIVILSESTCAGVGEWDESSWFPGYHSRPCVCPECGSYMGWEYQAIDHRALDDVKFYGLILPFIIGEHCK